MKQVGVFGSTGSIGVNTLEVIRAHPRAFRAAVLAAGSSVDLLANQAREFRPDTLVIGDASCEEALIGALGAEAKDFRILAGAAGLEEAAGDAALDIVMSGVTGAQGLPVSLGAARQGTRLGLANKESMVMAGPLLQDMASKSGCEIIPVDSEHSALFQCLLTGAMEDLGKLILTASGGPFRTLEAESFRDVTLEQALVHPTWSMGPKITIDSATMFNKALEIVEARWLFDAPREQLDVVVHPQSIVHSMVLWRDGSVISQMGKPDMKVPIQYALTYPQRLDGTVDTYSPELFHQLEFYAPDLKKFRSLQLGFAAAEQGGTSGAVLNAANEEAVAAFRRREISFQNIFDSVQYLFEKHINVVSPALDDILSADRWAREEFKTWTC